MSQSAGLRVSRAKRLHQAIGLQKTTMGEMILYLHTRQQAASKCSLRNHKLHINVQNRDFLFLWLKFCRFPPQDSRSASSQFLSLIPITSHNPPWEPHQLQNVVPTLLALTAPWSRQCHVPHNYSWAHPPQLVFSLHPFLLLHPIWANNSFAENMGGRSPFFCLLYA